MMVIDEHPRKGPTSMTPSVARRLDPTVSPSSGRGLRFPVAECGPEAEEKREQPTSSRMRLGSRAFHFQSISTPGLMNLFPHRPWGKRDRRGSSAPPSHVEVPWELPATRSRSGRYTSLTNSVTFLRRAV